jgi:hypothetical protein
MASREAVMPRTPPVDADGLVWRSYTASRHSPAVFKWPQSLRPLVTQSCTEPISPSLCISQNPEASNSKITRTAAIFPRPPPSDPSWPSLMAHHAPDTAAKIAPHACRDLAERLINLTRHASLSTNDANRPQSQRHHGRQHFRHASRRPNRRLAIPSHGPSRRHSPIPNPDDSPIPSRRPQHPCQHSRGSIRSRCNNHTARSHRDRYSIRRAWIWLSPMLKAPNHANFFDP